MNKEKFYLKNTETLEVFDFDTLQESNNFLDDGVLCPDPNLMICPDVLYFDGGGSNGSVSRYSFGKKDDIRVQELLVEITNNQAEYLGLLGALNMAEPYSHIIGDSELIIKQVKGEYQCKSVKLKSYCAEAMDLIEKLNITIEWSGRDDNIAGIEIDKIKSKKYVPYIERVINPLELVSRTHETIKEINFSFKDGKDATGKVNLLKLESMLKNYLLLINKMEVKNKEKLRK